MTRTGHLSCSACRLRLRADSPAVAILEGRCPLCAATLDACSSASDVVGFRSFDLDALFAPASEDQPGPPLDAAPFLARRETARRQDTHDAERWSDDGGQVAVMAVALPPPPP